MMDGGRVDEVEIGVAQRVYIETLGCRLNQAEMADLSRSLARLGYALVGEPVSADLVILNSCAVTAEAERKGRQAVRRLRATAPAAQLLLTGCLAERDATLGGTVEAMDWVLNIEAKRELLADPEALLPAIGPATAQPAGRTRAMVRVQEGCNNACSYCVVWQLRGPQRSRPANEVVAAVRELVADGHREVVLTGVHIGAYGRDEGVHGHTDLSGLLRRVIQETEVLPRLRLSSVEPWDVARLDLRLWEDPRLCPHLHLPLQSGSDSVLQHMGRRYTAGAYLALVERAREAIPGLAVTTDVIAGFPGETEADLERTLALAEACRFSRMHVFPYSERPGTLAAELPGAVPVPVRRERAARLRALASRLTEEFERDLIGTTQSVLCEVDMAGGWRGLAPNYAAVRVEGPSPGVGAEAIVRLTGRDQRGLKGTPLTLG